jgi:hypothetical protein
LTSVCRRFHDITFRILKHRLLSAASLRDHELILECFHPTTQYSTPHFFCEYLRTDGLSDDYEGQMATGNDIKPTGRLGMLANQYTHFRPLIPEEAGRLSWSHTAGDVPGHPNASTGSTDPSEAPTMDKENKFVCQDVHLESHEWFSQLCTITNLVKVGPRRGLFLSCVNVNDGVIRIWRDWLAKCAQAADDTTASTSTTSMTWDGKEDQRTLWVDTKNNVGVRFRVTEKPNSGHQPVLQKGEDAPVSYTVQYEGKCLFSILAGIWLTSTRACHTYNAAATDG